MSDVQAIYAAAWSRLTSATEGASVRAALGTPASIITVEQLRGVLPALPFLAWQGGGLGTSVGDADDLPFIWWICGRPLLGYRPIDGIVGLIRAAYPHDWLNGSFTRLGTSPKEQPDAALYLLMRPVSFIVSDRQ